MKPVEEIGTLRGTIAMARKSGRIHFVLKTRFGKRFSLEPGYLTFRALSSHLWDEVLVTGKIDRSKKKIQARTIVPLQEPVSNGQDEWKEESFNFGSEVQVDHIFDRVRGA